MENSGSKKELSALVLLFSNENLSNIRFHSIFYYASLQGNLFGGSEFGQRSRKGDGLRVS